MMNEDEKLPTTIREVGIHLGYIRKDINTLIGISQDAPSRKEFDALEDSAVKKEDIESLLNTWKVLTSTLGKILVGAFLLILLVSTYQVITNQIPKTLSGINATK